MFDHREDFAEHDLFGKKGIVACIVEILSDAPTFVCVCLYFSELARCRQGPVILLLT